MSSEEDTYLKTIASSKKRQLTALLSLARLLVEQRRFEEAEGWIRQVVEIRDPQFTPSALSLLGFVLTEQGRLEEAAVAYRESVENLNAVRKGH